MSSELVTVARFANSLEAHLAEMRLDAHGIDSIVVGESFAGLYQGSSMGSVEVQVSADKADEATKILKPQEQEQ